LNFQLTDQNVVHVKSAGKFKVFCVVAFAQDFVGW
jgi:hypothetical protein